MRGYTSHTYGEHIAGAFDAGLLAGGDLAGPDPSVEATVAFLAGLADGGRVLELGVGTGRIAIPLAARGVDVHGIDVSQRMLAELAAKPGGQQVTAHLGDMADVAVDGPFAVVVCVASSLYALTEQDEQVRCLRNAAAVLAPRGVLVIEGFVPDLGRFDRGQRLEARDLAADGVHLDASRHDPLTQRVSGQQIVITAAGIRLYPSHLRYVWPGELDLMARLAGLSPAGRWGGWSREPFTSDSRSHIACYTRPEASS